MRFVPAEPGDIEPYIKQAKKEWLEFSPGTTHLLCYDDEDNLVGFCGYVLYPNKMKIKNAFLFPEYRGRGFYSEMLEYRIEIARSLGLSRVVGDMTPPSLPGMLRLGARVIRSNKTTTAVVLDLGV